MYDSKQMALIYLREQANRLSSVCDKNIHSKNKKKTLAELEEQIGITFSALKEVGEEFKLDEHNVEVAAMTAYENRLSEK